MLDEQQAEFLSPIWFEEKYDHLEKKLFSFFDQTLQHRISQALAVFLLTICFAYLARSFHRNSFFLFFDVEIDRKIAQIYLQRLEVLCGLMAIGGLSFFLTKRNHIYGFFFFICGLILSDTSLIALTENVISAVFLALICVTFFKIMDRRLILSQVLAVSAFYFGLFFVFKKIGLNSTDDLKFSAIRIAFPIWYMLAESRVGISLTIQDWGLAIFSPASISTFLPIRKKHRLFSDQFSTRLHGVRDFIFGILFLCLALLLEGHSRANLRHDSVLSFLRFGFIRYLNYFFLSYAWMAFPVGIGRWYGIDLPDYFRHALLAVSPADRWRRWNTYYYDWFFTFIFYPIFRKTRSVFLAVVFVFFATILIHCDTYYYWFFDFGNFFSDTIIYELCLFFIFHAILVYFSIQLFPQLNGSSRQSWWGVLMTTFLMSLVHILAI